jgi:2-iminobutanoate/2-iminopropanoate deaminase
MTKQKIDIDRLSKRKGAYSHAVSVDVGDARMIFTTIQLATDEYGNVLYEMDPEEQAKYIFEGLERILNEAGATLNDVVKTTMYLTQMSDFPKLAPIRDRYFEHCEPAASIVEVTSLLKPGCLVGIDVIAIKEKEVDD